MESFLKTGSLSSLTTPKPGQRYIAELEIGSQKQSGLAPKT
jgi:hypothetical protein